MSLRKVLLIIAAVQAAATAFIVVCIVPRLRVPSVVFSPEFRQDIRSLEFENLEFVNGWTNSRPDPASDVCCIDREVEIAGAGFTVLVSYHMRFMKPRYSDFEHRALWCALYDYIREIDSGDRNISYPSGKQKDDRRVVVCGQDVHYRINKIEEVGYSR